MRKIIIAGNWKMNKDLAETRSFVSQIGLALGDLELGEVIPIVAPAYPFLGEALQLAEETALQICAQDVSANNDGAFTGEVSARMLASMGLKYGIVGHSERRQYHGETDATICIKMHKLLEHKIKPIVCVGETLAQREAGDTEEVVLEQLNGCLKDLQMSSGEEIYIAYEPVWAIGTGKTATPQQAQEVHALIRLWLSKKFHQAIADRLPILYGGSVKPENIKDLLSCPDIDGGLIGGASLKAPDFTSVVLYNK